MSSRNKKGKAAPQAATASTTLSDNEIDEKRGMILDRIKFSQFMSFCGYAFFAAGLVVFFVQEPEKRTKNVEEVFMKTLIKDLEGYLKVPALFGLSTWCSHFPVGELNETKFNISTTVWNEWFTWRSLWIFLFQISLAAYPLLCGFYYVTYGTFGDALAIWYNIACAAMLAASCVLPRPQTGSATATSSFGGYIGFLGQQVSFYIGCSLLGVAFVTAFAAKSPVFPVAAFLFGQSLILQSLRFGSIQELVGNCSATFTFSPLVFFSTAGSIGVGTASLKDFVPFVLGCSSLGAFAFHLMVFWTPIGLADSLQSSNPFYLHTKRTWGTFLSEMLSNPVSGFGDDNS